MSVWTHVAGIIRIEGVRELSWTDKKITYTQAIEKALAQNDCFGQQYGFDDDWPEDPANPIPFGSEGTVRYYVVARTGTSLVCSHDIVIHGDLRDYEDIEAVIKWFINGCDHLYVRQAVITVNDGVNVQTYGYPLDKRF